VGRPGFQTGKLIAGALCVLLIVFMTVEASHSHPPSDTLHHTFCYWCFAAHNATAPPAAVVPRCDEFTQEKVLAQETRERALLLVRLEPVRPPPSQPKDQSE
jgi:hypothetical protein